MSTGRGGRNLRGDCVRSWDTPHPKHRSRLNAPKNWVTNSGASRRVPSRPNWEVVAGSPGSVSGIGPLVVSLTSVPSAVDRARRLASVAQKAAWVGRLLLRYSVCSAATGSSRAADNAGYTPKPTAIAMQTMTAKAMPGSDHATAQPAKAAMA